MKDKQDKIDRRIFLQKIGAAGFASVCASAEAVAGTDEPEAAKEDSKPKYPQVPKRKLGKTGIKVPCLSLGGNQDLVANQIVLRRAPQWGVYFWDTAYVYRGGNSEIGIGRYLARNPKARKKLFIASKASDAWTVPDVQKRFETSLERMKTDYIDLYFGAHQCPDPARLTKELEKWAENAKKRNLIQFFGISTHQNMARVLAAAAKLGWIDAILTTYNFRLQKTPRCKTPLMPATKPG